MNISLPLDPPCDITIATGLLRTPAMWQPCLGTETVIVADSNVAPLYLDTLAESLRSLGRPVYTTVFPAGENSKSLATVQQLLSSFADCHLTRTGTVVALGGGVTGDLAGFAAAIWLRGVNVVQAPTSLLAMVDSSVGGKTAVDLPCGKNLVGAFHQPRAVFADTATLHTLRPLQRQDGFAEMLKAGVIADPALFRQLADHPDNALRDDCIADAVRVKADIVARDPQEHGERKLLNLGHTAGHAIEHLSHFALSHGHAVAIGLALVADAGVRHGLTAPDCRDAIHHALRQADLPTASPFPLSELLNLMTADKKRAGNSLTIVVPETIGHCRLHTLPLSELAAFWN